jgi:hypothetical protein
LLDDNYRIVGLNNGALFYTTTGSSTLTSLDPTGVGSVIPDFYVARLAFSPTNKNTVYIALGNYSGGTLLAQSHVWKVTNLDTVPVLTPVNGSSTFAPSVTALPDVPVNSFVVDPLNTNKLYAGTDIGVYNSVDGGTNWLPFGTGLPRLAVFDMAIAPGRTLRIATHGRGMWQIPLLAPTAANASVSGRVTTAGGRPIRNVTLVISGGSLGEPKYARTNSFGYYRFLDLEGGQTYVLSVAAKRYTFANPTRVITLDDNIDGEDFVSDSK